MLRFKAVLFDLDGTLLDSVPIILKCNEEVHGAMGLSYDADVVRNCIGIPLKVQAARFAGERASEFMERYRHVYLRHREMLFPGTRSMLEELRSCGYQTGVVTSKASRGAVRVIDLNGLMEKFDVIVTADDVKKPKPDAEPILKALDVLRVDPSEAVYVGDSLYDIDAARQAKVAAAAVTWGARSRNDLQLMCPDGVFDNWQEFMCWLNGKT